MDKPLSLYKYRPPEVWAFDDLSMGVVRYSHHHVFNDPCDFLIAPSLRGMTDEQFESLRKQRPDLFESVSEDKKAFIERHDRQLVNTHLHARQFYRFACFSACHKNLLMWSHYGGHGQGFCLEYDTAKAPIFNHPAKMTYRKKKPDVSDAIEVLTQDKNHSGPYQGFMAHKPLVWKYEQEWRLLEKNWLMSARKPYSRDTLTAVYFGIAATNATKERVRAIVEKEYPDAKMWQGELERDKYKIKFDKPYP